MPEGKTHLTLRTFLYQLLQFALGPAHSVGSELERFSDLFRHGRDARP
jgi:hypothetical protein